MARTEDFDYYHQRVISERQRAATAPNKVIAGVHMRLADLYEELIEDAEGRNVVPFPTLAMHQNDNR